MSRFAAYRWPLFVLMVAAQLAVPAWMIHARERVLRQGEVYRFRAEPVDPYDAFRGRYVSLALRTQHVPAPADHAFGFEDVAYVRLGRDADGFARLESADPRRPKDGDYLRLRVVALDPEGLRFDLPYDRFYLNERLAPAAEAAYRRHTSGGRRAAWVDLRVLRGRGVIEDLYIDGVPIVTFVQRSR